MISDEDRVEYMDGWFAQRDDLSVDKNPYDKRLQSKSFSLWESGWCARFNAIKHGLDLALDDLL